MVGTSLVPRVFPVGYVGYKLIAREGQSIAVPSGQARALHSKESCLERTDQWWTCGWKFIRVSISQSKWRNELLVSIFIRALILDIPRLQQCTEGKLARVARTCHLACRGQCLAVAPWLLLLEMVGRFRWSQSPAGTPWQKTCWRFGTQATSQQISFSPTRKHIKR